MGFLDEIPQYSEMLVETVLKCRKTNLTFFWRSGLMDTYFFNFCLILMEKNRKKLARLGFELTTSRLEADRANHYTMEAWYWILNRYSKSLTYYIGLDLNLTNITLDWKCNRIYEKANLISDFRKTNISTKMRQDLKKSVSIMTERDENVLSFGFISCPFYHSQLCHFTLGLMRPSCPDPTPYTTNKKLVMHFFLELGILTSL